MGLKPKERQQRIRDVIAETGEMSVEALARQFDVSAETIRRDLGRLAQSGALQKVHGGARRNQLHAEGSFQERMSEQAGAKAEIARKLARMVEPGDTIFIDTGSTTLICAEALAETDDLTIITNSLRIAQVMGRTGRSRVFLLGGSFSPDNAETLGPLVIDQIGRFQADHAVLSAAAVDAKAGVTNADFDEALIARAMMDRSSHAVLVADHTKLGRKAAFRVCRLDEVDVLVCDQAPDAEFAGALALAGVELR